MYNVAMTDSMASLLRDRYAEPPEIKAIQDYVQAHFRTSVGVTVHQQSITINAPNSALAASLRMYTHQLRELIGENKRLVIRIGR